MSQDVDSLKNHSGVLRYYQQKLNLTRQGREFVGKCPLHSEKTGSFKVYQDGGTWIWKCHGRGKCGAGNVFQLIQKMDNVSFNEAVEKVKDFIGGAWKEVDETFRPFSEPTEVVTIPAAAYKRFEDALSASEPAQKFLKSRGISLETACKLRVGFRQSVPYDEDIADKGWLVFPVFDGEKVISLKYRSISKKAFTKQKGMQNGLFGGVPDALEPIFLCEGELDTLAMEQAGFRSVSLPSAGTKLTPEMKDILLQADSIILAGDTDPVGVEAMTKIWNELQDRTFLLTWPEGMKDANETFLTKCGGDVEKFRDLVNELTQQAKTVPMPGVYSLQESMLRGEQKPADHPERLQFPWPSVDRMIHILPGNILSIFSSATGMGKTSFLMNLLVHAAKRGDVILNYSAELTVGEYSTLVASHITGHDRNTLSPRDYQEAAKILGGARFYIGYNPDLSTVDDALNLIERAVRHFSASLVAIDHIHYLVRNEPDTIKAQENAMQKIKRISLKYNCKFIVVGQPRKADQQRKGKMVHLADWKGSEVAASDTSALIALHRDLAKITDKNNPPKEPYEPVTQVHLLKGRSQAGGAAYTELMFLGNIATFSEMTYREHEPVETQNLYSM